MKHLIKNILFFLLVNVGIFCVILFAIRLTFTYKHWEKDPDVFVIPQHQTYQLLFMGNSHARIFTRFNNHHIVEDILDQSFFNISQPSAGPVAEKLYLQYFLERGNHADTIIYFIDPNVFYSDRWNENYELLLYGELDPHFLKDSIQNGVGYETNMYYVKTYLSLKWFIKNPKPDVSDTRMWEESEEGIAGRLKLLYPNGSPDSMFEKYANTIDEITEIAKNNNIQIVFVIPSTKIKDQSGMHKLIDLLHRYEKEQQISFYDFSRAIEDPNLYSDPDHLNTQGVTIFTESYLKTIPEIKNKN